jgi:1-acyl-sn-glycerol-3-phosphate acyltransferase
MRTRLKSVDLANIPTNSAGYDRWGLDPKLFARLITQFSWLFTHYFRATCIERNRVPSGRVMLIANHGGQFPIDGLLITLAMALTGHERRFVRSMVDRWVPSLPFISTLFNRCGQMVGHPQNAADLLNHEQCVLVFPEGTKGSGKNFSQRYQLQNFGTGFVRLARETNTPIVPVAVIGSEEMYPALFHLPALAKLLAMPYFPVTPFFPLLGIAGLVPLPTRVQIRFGEPIYVHSLKKGKSATSAEAEISGQVALVKKALEREIAAGLKARKGNVF